MIAFQKRQVKKIVRGTKPVPCRMHAVILGLHVGYIGLYWDYIGVILGIMEKKMETTIGFSSLQQSRSKSTVLHIMLIIASDPKFAATPVSC